VKKRTMHVPDLLNEAFHYAKPVPFSRGMRLDFGSTTVLLISGTASIDERGQTVHVGDLRAQTRRTFKNLTGLLGSEGLSWHDVVYTRIYLRDIERDYEALNEERIGFFREQEIPEYPASCCVQAHLCRSELLVEIEAVAVRDPLDEA
jgi:enamine deaminase RidA (YjgF/YER057c/UK114 family)